MQIVPLRGKAGCGKFVIVDDADYEWASTLKLNYQLGRPPQRHCKHRDGTGYAVTRQRDSLHRLVLEKHGHELTKDVIVDHHNGWGLDNRRVNLRPGDQCQNMRNTRRRQIAVFDGGFQVRFNGIRLGVFPTIHEAECEWDRLAPEYGFVPFVERDRLLQPVIEFMEGLVGEGILRRHLQNAPLVEDRFRLI